MVTVVEQLAGCAVPASALESLVLPSRVADYQPSMLDELTATGEVLWAGHGGLPGSDGWVSLHLADTAPLTLPDHGELEMSADHEAVLEALGRWRRLLLPPARRRSVGTSDDKALSAALWDLAWSGRVGNDTLAPLRALTRGGRSAHRVKRGPARVRGVAAAAHRAQPCARRRPTSPGAGSCCPRARPTRPSAPTPSPRACSSGTAWSPAAR